MNNFKYKYVIWDWNGTIIDDAWLCVEILNKILGKRGISEITTDTYMQHFDFPVKDFYKKIGFDFSKESFDSLADEYMSIYNTHSYNCVLQTGVESIISLLQENGIKQSILSASKQSTLNKAVEHYSLITYFEKVCGLSDHYANSKLDLARDLISRIRFSVNDILLIGDTTHDYEAADSFGIDCVLICSGHQAKERLVACGVPVLERIAEIKEIFNYSL